MRSDLWLLARFVMYALAAVASVHFVVVAAQWGYAPIVAQESGPLEILQAVLGFLAFCGFAAAARGSRDCPAMLELAAAGLLFIVIRELDYPLDQAFGMGSYKYFNTPVVLWALYLLARSWRVLPGELSAFIRSPEGFLSFFGLFLVVMHGQVFGQRELWIVLVDTHEELKLIKRIVEETSETPGYFFLVGAALEAVLANRDAGTESIRDS
jgi:hypothetical protein